MATVFQPCKTVESDRFYRCTKTRCGHKWTVRYREPGGRGARQREKSFDKKTDADNFATKVENDKREGVYLDPERGKLPVRMYALEWLDRYAGAPRSRLAYENLITNWVVPILGRKSLAGVGVEDVLGFRAVMQRKGLAPSTINNRMIQLAAIFAAAVREKRIRENPCAEVEPLRQASKAVDEDEIPAVGQVHALADAMFPPLRLTVWLMAGAGCRIGEALGFTADGLRDGFVRLRWQSGDKGGGAQLVPLKHRAEGDYRDIPSTPGLDSEIERHVTEYGVHVVEGKKVLFVSRARTRGAEQRIPVYQTYDYHWNRALEAAGLAESGFTPHSLRHFFASVALAEGVPITDVSKWLGHKSIKVTADTYGHLTPDAAERFRGKMQAALWLPHAD